MIKNIFFNIAFLFLAAVFFYSCAKEDELVTTSNFHSPFTGSYQFRFNIGLTGNGILVVDNEGNFQMPITISGVTSPLVAKGIVLNSGIITGNFYADTTSIGTLQGQLLNPYSSAGSSDIQGNFGYWVAVYIY